MKKAKILITGASGCVGQYITKWLLKNSDADLYLWLRDPKKLSAIPKEDPRIKLLIGDIRQPEIFSDELSEITRVIHTATAWGDPSRAYQVNVLAVKDLFNLLNPEVIEQIIYFSTASILNKNLDLLPEALSYGTEYIQTKAQCLQALEKHPLAEKIIAVFPTLVFGGKVDSKSLFPTSYLTGGLSEACHWLWLARWLRTDSSFHFIHAADIAFICGHLATTPHSLNSKTCQRPIRRLVMAQPAITINESVKILCLWRGVQMTPGLPLWGWLIEALIKILPIQVSNWDRFSIKQRHFVHDPISFPEHFGGTSQAKVLWEVLVASGLPKSKPSKKRGKVAEEIK